MHAMRRLGPFAAVALIAALDALLAAAAADCTCRAQGREFQLGESACLTSPKGARLATCGMVLNNSSWQFSETPCTVSAVPRPDQPRPVQAQHGTADPRTTLLR
jgi:hypothetical protein